MYAKVNPKMPPKFRSRAFPLALLIGTAWATGARADFVVGPFGPNGEGGLVNGQSIAFGTQGSVFELDAFVSLAGQDLNGGDPGISRRLSSGVPPGLSYQFSSSLSLNRQNLLLTYRFTNTSGGTLPGFQFMTFVDAEIAGTTSFIDEFGTNSGVLGTGSGDSNPDSWEIDEPGFAFGDIVANLLTGNLDNTNSIPVGTPEDVSLALGFRLGTLNPLDVATINILLSENGSSIGAFSLRQFDSITADSLTLSGQATVTAVPEPSTALLCGIGLLGLLGYASSRKYRSRRA